MQKIISILFALSVIFCGATVDAKTTKRSSGKKKTSTSASLGIKKGAVNSYGDYLKTQIFTIDKGDNGKIEVEYPISGDPKLVKSIRTYIKDCINRDYKGALETPDGLLSSAMKGVGRNYNYDADINVIYSTPKLITFESTGYEYAGGAHGMSWNSSSTFIVETGQRFSASMLPAFDKMHDYILEALARDRESTVDELLQMFYNPDPNTVSEYGVVYITKDGINVLYQPYEIGPYMEGFFHGVIPFSEVNDILPEKTRSLLE